MFRLTDYEVHVPPVRDWPRLWWTRWSAMADWTFGRAWRLLQWRPPYVEYPDESRGRTPWQ